MIKKPEVERVQYNPTELAYRSIIIEKMQKARDVRESPHVEFDDQTYSGWWESCARAANSYIPPKTNPQDVRIVTGTTHEKNITLISTLLNYNLEPDIEAFDEYDRKVHELGGVMEKLIKKSRKIESPTYDEKKTLYYKEALDQGTAFIEDAWKEFSIPDKVLKDINWQEVKTSDIDWENRLEKVYKYCDSHPICGLNVYLGNIRQFHLELQPFVVVRRLIPRMEAQAIYGKWERWKNVPYNIERIQETSDDDVDYNDWTLERLEEDMVEEIKFYSKYDNNFMLMLNGVMMFPVKEENNRYSTVPLSSLTGVCEYPMAKVDIEPISNWAYSKGIPAKTKVDQQVFDEMLKSIILKTRKSYNPPIANNTNKSLSTRIFDPGTIHDGVDATKIAEIGNNTGVTNAEFNATEFIKSIIDGKSVAPVYEGQAEKGNQTAREIIERKQQSMLKLGLVIYGIINMEKRLAWLRLHNILRHWTKAEDTRIVSTREGIKEVSTYKTVEVEDTLENGRNGTTIIDFTTEPLPTSEQIEAREKILSNRGKGEVRKIYVNPEELKNVKYKWFIEVTPTEKDSTELKTALFEDFIQKIFGVFVPLGKMPNIDYLADRFAVMNGENPDQVWQQQQPMPQQGMMPGMGQPIPVEGAQGVSAQMQPRPAQPVRPQQPNAQTLAPGGQPIRQNLT